MASSLIRLASTADVLALAELEHATYQAEGYPAALFYQAIAQWPQTQLVATATSIDSVHGYIMAAPGEQTDDLWIMSLLVASEARGQGLGKQLLQALLKSAAQQPNNYRTATLTVAPYNAAAIALYQQQGFQQIALKPNFMGPGEDRIILQHNFC